MFAYSNGLHNLYDVFGSHLNDLLLVMSDLKTHLGPKIIVGGQFAVLYNMLSVDPEYRKKIKKLRLGDLDIIVSGGLSSVSKGVLEKFTIVFLNKEYMALRHDGTGVKVDIFTTRVPDKSSIIPARIGFISPVGGLELGIASLPHMLAITVDDLKRALDESTLPIAIKQIHHAKRMMQAVSQDMSLISQVDQIWSTLKLGGNWREIYDGVMRRFDCYCEDTGFVDRFADDPFAKPWYKLLLAKLVYDVFLTRVIRLGLVKGW